LHKTGILQDAQVTRHGWPAYGKSRRDFSDGKRAAAQFLQYRAPHRIPEGIEYMHMRNKYVTFQRMTRGRAKAGALIREHLNHAGSLHFRVCLGDHNGHRRTRV